MHPVDNPSSPRPAVIPLGRARLVAFVARVRNRLRPGLAAGLLFATAAASADAAQSYSRINKLFDGGSNSYYYYYHSFRIPSIVRASGGVLVAFAEGRADDEDDWGNINLVYRRSTDNGATWSPLTEIEGAGLGSWTNPTAVYEGPWTGHPNGRVHLFFNWHSSEHTDSSTIEPGDRKTYYTYSDDNGVTWQPKQDLTATLLPAGMAWDAVGPGNGIRKSVAPNIGRLIVPATGRNFYSDNHGASWAYARVPTSGTIKTGESAIAECLGGELYRNDRATGTYWPTAKRRWVAYGTIDAFPVLAPQNNLLDPRMQGSLLRYNRDAPDRILFLNSDSTENRRRMKVRISYDDGLTWPRDRWLYVGTPPDYHATIDAAMDAGKGGYSSMTKTGDYHVAALVEVNENFTTGVPHQSIDFHKFNLEWIRNGQPDP
ncbi:MAG TPA: sialidase family protein [Opitutaceae bacterium]